LKILRSTGVGFLAFFLAGPMHASAGTMGNQFARGWKNSNVEPSEEFVRGAEASSGQEKAQSPSETASKASDAEKTGDSYSIGIGDDLQISVWREPELSMPVQVRPDGMITLPLINDLPVVGLTTHQLQALLTEKLKPFVNEPQVTVIVRGIHSRRVYLMGQVAKPGPYPLNDKKTVLQLITEAGGPGQFAKTGSIYIIRTVDGKQTRLKFNYKKALAGKADAGDVELLPGDMVVIP
jgi:polysaccharide export outer membrane protein